eukprot:m.224518 g.224518  ORF g.224518 m.224518 type:complete len:353 (-) comp11101_c0_seq1:114-1172(-)
MTESKNSTSNFVYRPSLAAMSFGLSRLVTRAATRGIPLIRAVFQAESPAVRDLRTHAGPAISNAGGSVVVDPRNGPAFPPMQWTESALPRSIEMLTSNNVDVSPALLLKALPWDAILSNVVRFTVGNESLLQDLKKTHDDLLRWRDLNHLVNPRLAVEICQKVSTLMMLREMEHVVAGTPSGPSGLIAEAFKNNDIEIAKVAERHTKIQDLLRQNSVAEAYERAQGALRSLETVHNMLDNARMRALELQRDAAWGRRTLAAVGATCVVLGLACDFLAGMPGDLPSVIPILRDTIATGAVLCLSVAGYSMLTSDSFGEYMTRFRTAQDARIKMRLRLEEDINSCLDAGVPLRH